MLARFENVNRGLNENYVLKSVRANGISSIGDKKMDLTSKTIPLIAASLLAMSALYCEAEDEEAMANQERGMKQSEESSGKRGAPLCNPLTPTCQPFVCKPEKCGNVQEAQTPSVPAYNAAAEINTGIMGDWNTFATGSVLYWQPMQDDMRIATQGFLAVGSILGAGTTDHQKTIDMSFGFKPGFKLAAGVNFRNDNWVGYIEYTRLRGTDSVSATTPSSNPTLYNLWGENLAATTVFNSLDAEFKCKLDFIDMEMERSYFVGRKLTFRSGMGLRVALITESLDANYSYDGSILTNSDAVPEILALPGYLDAVNRTISWGIGPRMGLEMDWLLGVGIRIFGSGFADVLYTSYKIQTKSRTFPSASSSPFVVGNAVTTTNRDDDTGMLRAHLDFELGMGWGTYFDYNNMHIDLAASYGFQVFFNQNMLRLPSYSPSNLYIQGLTFTVRMDF